MSEWKRQRPAEGYQNNALKKFQTFGIFKTCKRTAGVQNVEERSDRTVWQRPKPSFVTRQLQNAPRCLVLGVPSAWLGETKREVGQD